MEPRTILVVRLTALGDVLFTLPAVAALRRRWPELEIDWVVEDRAASILDLFGPVGQKIVYRRRLLSHALPRPHRWPALLAELVRHLRRLRSRRYDVVLDFQGNLKSGVHVLLARSARSVGFARGHVKEASHLLYRERVTPDPTVRHRIDKALALAGILDVARDGLEPPELEPGDEAHRFAEQALPTVGLGPDDSFVVLHPGTSEFGSFKRWPADRFAFVADLLGERHGFKSLVTYGPGEEELARRVVELSRSGAATLSPRTPGLPHLAAVLQRARLMVGSDSAPLHLAAFLGTPVVALFGPKDPAVYGPRFAPVRIVRTYVPCSPCDRRQCPDALCMAEIRVGQVTQAVEELLATGEQR